MRQYFARNVSLAPVPYLMSILGLERTMLREFTNFFVVVLGVGLLSLLAQVAIPLPWTPVPVTGQTFGVLLLSLLLGRTRAVVTVGSYIAIGALGSPIFALGQAGLVLPRSGYLLGMLIASFVVGWLSDRGWNSKFSTCVAAGLISSVIVFGCGLAVLSQFVPSEGLLSMGLIPFLPGDILKITLASVLVAPLGKGVRRI